MTAVTTSRKPDPGIRTLGRDFAVAIGAPFFTRGKQSLSEAIHLDDVVWVVGQHARRPVIDLYVDGEPVLHLSVRGSAVAERTGVRWRGVGTGDQSIYQILGKYLNAFQLHAERHPGEIVFDGRGRSRYTLTLSDDAHRHIFPGR